MERYRSLDPHSGLRLARDYKGRCIVEDFKWNSTKINGCQEKKTSKLNKCPIKVLVTPIRFLAGKVWGSTRLCGVDALPVYSVPLLCSAAGEMERGACRRLFIYRRICTPRTSQGLGLALVAEHMIRGVNHCSKVFHYSAD